MQALKVLVILMGILIVIGTAVVVVTIATRFGGGAEERTARPGAAAAPTAFGEANLPMPEGCRLVSLTAAGERLLLRLGSGGDCEQILVLDMGTGSLLGRFRLTPAAE